MALRRVPAMSSITAFTCCFVARSENVGLLANFGGERVGLVEEQGLRYDPVQETERLGLLGAERPARQNEFLRHGRPELAHQARDPAPGERDTEIDLGDREANRVGGQPEVTGRGEHEATAHAVPVDRCDGEWSAVGQRLGGEAPEVGVVARRSLLVEAPEVVQVEPGRERPAGAPDHDRLDHRRLVQPTAGGDDLAAAWSARAR